MRWFLFGAVPLSLLTGCTATPPVATPSSQPIFGSAATASLILSPTATSPVRATPTPPPQPGAATSCLDNATFLEDLTIPDGSQVLPGAPLEKRWSVRNSGTCDWGPEYRLAQVGSSDIHGPAEIALYPATAGSTAVWQVALTAPAFAGEYLGRWQARAPDGSLFGDEVFVLIIVAEPEPTETPSASQTP